MKILSIDSSNNKASIALYDTRVESMLFAIVENSKSSSLMPLVQKSFEDIDLKPQEIDLLICNIGPGSFTGIRTTVTICKTIAAELNIKIFPVNNFQLLRFENSLEYNFSLAIKAGKNDYFISKDSNYQDLSKNFYSTNLDFEILYEFKEKNIAKLMIDFFLSFQNPELIGYKDLEPYYLREPSIGLKKMTNDILNKADKLLELGKFQEAKEEYLKNQQITQAAYAALLEEKIPEALELYLKAPLSSAQRWGLFLCDLFTDPKRSIPSPGVLSFRLYFEVTYSYAYRFSIKNYVNIFEEYAKSLGQLYPEYESDMNKVKKLSKD